jgi:hypothetical protein
MALPVRRRDTAPITLPGAADADGVEARLDDGILKPAQERPRQFEVKAG